MKRLIFSICVIVVVVVTSMFTNTFFKNASLEFSTAAKLYAQKADEDSIRQYGEELEDLWEKKKMLISFFSPQAIYEQADREIEKLKYASSLKEFKTQCEKTAELLQKASQTDLPKTDNIF